MLIFSQDRTEIVNLDVIENIWICPDGESRFSIEATAGTNSTLGYYSTEERAKDVLKEILTAFVRIKLSEDGTSVFGSLLSLPANSIFEMPLN